MYLNIVGTLVSLQYMYIIIIYHNNNIIPLTVAANVFIAAVIVFLSFSYVFSSHQPSASYSINVDNTTDKINAYQY